MNSEVILRTQSAPEGVRVVPFRCKPHLSEACETAGVHLLLRDVRDVLESTRLIDPGSIFFLGGSRREPGLKLYLLVHLSLT